MSDAVVIDGVRRVSAHLERMQVEIRARRMRAARSAANVFRRHVRAEARKHRGTGAVMAPDQLGRIRSRAARSGERGRHMLETRVELDNRVDGFAVRDRAPQAHLVVKGHEIVGHLPNHTATGERTGRYDFIHDAYIAAGAEPLIAARVVLFEGGPEVPES